MGKRGREIVGKNVDCELEHEEDLQALRDDLQMMMERRSN
jgi:hypothetical protein